MSEEEFNRIMLDLGYDAYNLKQLWEMYCTYHREITNNNPKG